MITQSWLNDKKIDDYNIDYISITFWLHYDYILKKWKNVIIDSIFNLGNKSLFNLKKARSV